MAKKAFVSYDAERHGNYKNLISAGDSSDARFVFNDNSTDTSINSTNIDYIKSRIKNAINESDVFIVIVGDYASSNRGVDGECQQARSAFKPIYAIKIESHYQLPDALKGYYNLKELNGFTKSNIGKALGLYG